MKYTILIIINICFSLTLFANATNIENISFLNIDSIDEVERVLRENNIEDSLLIKEDTHLSNIQYTDLRAKISKDSIHICYNAIVPFDEISSIEGLYIIPVYRSNNKQFFFQKVIINGKDRNKYYLREQNLKSHYKYFKQKPYTLSVLKDSNNINLSYNIEQALPKNINKDGIFTLEELKLNCSGLHIHAIRKINKLLAINKNNLAFVRPPKHTLKIKPKSTPLTLDFTINYQISSNKIVRDFSNNLREFTKIQATLGNPEFDNQYNIKNLSIVGSSSPESNEKYNNKLSLNRAIILQDYLLNNFDFLKDVNFDVKGLGENWKGLKQEILASNLTEKDTLLAIINNDSISNTEREIRFKKITKGNTYNFISKNYFPPLRRMDSRIIYEDKIVNKKEAIKEVRQENISHQEIFDAALENDNMKMMTQTVFFFPNSNEAYNNAAAVELLNEKPSVALKYLKKIWDKNIAYNNIGIYYLEIGNRELAIKYFNMAIKTNTNKEKAELNLNLLDKYDLR